MFFEKYAIHQKLIIMKTLIQINGSKLLAGILLISLLVGSCTSPSKLINSGHYDSAIDLSVKKLRKNKNKVKYIESLKDAFHKANQRDLDRISFLRKEGKPDNSVAIFDTYTFIKQRQDKIRPLMPLYIEGDLVEFQMISVDDEIISSKKEAAGYMYTHAISLLERNEKFSAREAYEELRRVKDMFHNYQDVDAQIQKAFDMGMNWVLLDIENNTPNLIPKEFEEELFNMDLASLQGKWYTIIAANRKKEGDKFDFIVNLNLKFVDVGPELVKEKLFDEKKKVQDGYEYVLDEKGNVKKDSLGNDMKVPKMVEIVAHVTEVQQTKAATFKGNLEFIDRFSNQKVRTETIDITALFDHFSATATGNLNALTPETKKKAGIKPVPFPSDFEMMMDGARRLKPIVYDLIKRNKNILES